MRIRQVIEIFEERHPRYLQEEWDNSRVQLGDVDQEVKNIMFALEITQETIDEAIEKDCNLIICHHPLIFPNINRLDSDYFKGQKIIRAIKNDIVIYASHTASDVSGLNEYIFKKIGYKSDGKIVETVDEYGYGSFADINDSLKDIVGKLKGNLKLCHVIIWGEENKTRQENRIGLVTGSGMDFIQEAMDKDINIFITGDINHHDAMDAMEQGMTLIDISHEGSEAFFVDFVEEIFENDDRLSGIKTYKYYNELKYLRRIV